MYSIKLTTAADYKRYADVIHTHDEYDTSYSELKRHVPFVGDRTTIEEEQEDGSVVATINCEYDNIARLMHTWITTAMADKTFDPDDSSEWDSYPKNSWQYKTIAKIRAWVSGMPENNHKYPHWHAYQD